MIILAYGLQISSLNNMSLIFFLTLKITKIVVEVRRKPRQDPQTEKFTPG